MILNISILNEFPKGIYYLHYRFIIEVDKISLKTLLIDCFNMPLKVFFHEKSLLLYKYIRILINLFYQ